MVNFSIDTNGNVVNPTIVRGIKDDCDQEALRLVKPMPQWISGTERGSYTVVVKF